jgi:hypothetical protein
VKKEKNWEKSNFRVINGRVVPLEKSRPEKWFLKYG